jgi:DNA-binding transcriptional MerR regulator
MLINEVSKITGLTKKAIEYYVDRELLYPSILENGYRDFSISQVEQLKKISTLRKLGIGTEDIRTLLSDESRSSFHTLSIQKELNIQREQAKKSILDKLALGKDYSEISDELQMVENSKTITEKLLEAFPGYYGRFICLHFARFLNEPIKTSSQQSAYKRIISFLDNTPPLKLPEDLQEYLIESTKHIGTVHIKEMLENTKKSIENPDDFLSNNKEILEQYLAYRQSDGYKISPAYKIMSLMKDLNKESGYYDVFIPALKELSTSYEEYYKKLEIANVKLLNEYPDIEKLYD